MVSNDEFFQRKQAAAVLKHGVLERYMTVFAAMTGSASTAGRVHYIDGYAGPGRYEPEEGQTVGSPGSPLLAAETAAHLSDRNLDLRCTFIERDAKHAANLSATLDAEWKVGGSYEILRGEVETHLASAIEGSGINPLLIFLDPFGTALAYDLLVEQMLRRATTAKTEVLLNFNIGSVRRIGGRLFENLAEGSAEHAAREQTLRRVDTFLGGDWWRQLYARNFDSQQGAAGRAATVVADQFRARLEAATGFKSIGVPIRRRPVHAPLFLLTLFYRHNAAPYQFADAASLANRDWRNYNRQLDLADELALRWTDDGLFSLDDLITTRAGQDADDAEATLNANWIVGIANNVRALMQSRWEIPVAPNIAEIYGDAFGVAGEKHLRAAWDTVAAEGLIRTRDKSKRIWMQTISRVTP